MRPFRIFFDSEFSGLGVVNPRLVSIGCITHSGEDTFYAEVPLTPGLVDASHPWVRANVLPHLERGEAAMAEDEIGRRLHAWLCALAPERELILISDSPSIDGLYLDSLLKIAGYPPNMDRRIRPMKMPSPMGWQRYHLALETAQKSQLRAHHALDDARANRLAWLAGQGFQGELW